MAVTVDSAVAYALQQPGVRPACLVTVCTSGGADTLRFSVDTITWSGLTYGAYMRQPPRISVSPSAPEHGQVGATTLALDLVDPDGTFGSKRPGYFEGASCSVAYVVTDVESSAFRTFGFRITDVAKPDLTSFTMTGEDGLSALRRTAFPADRLLISNAASLNSNQGHFSIWPHPQPHIEGANKCFPIMYGQCVAPAIVDWTIALNEPGSGALLVTDSGNSIVFAPIFAQAGHNYFGLVQRWNDNWSQVASLRDSGPLNIDDGIHDPATPDGIHAGYLEVNAGTPLHEGFQVVPIYYGGLAGIFRDARHTVTPPEVLRTIVDSSYDSLDDRTIAIGIPYDTAASNSLHAVYANGLDGIALKQNAGSAAAYPMHGFHGYIADQRPADQWVGAVLHDGMMGVVWRAQLIPLGLCFSRSCVGSFTAANIVEGTLSYRDTPPSQLETTRTIFYRRQSRDVEPVTSYTWSAAPNGASTSRVSDFIGHALSAWRPAQFWAKREAFGRRRYTWRTGFHAWGMEQHDLVTVDFPIIGANSQVCEVDAVELLPDWSVQVQARESSFDLYTFTNTPDFNWSPNLRFAERVRFPQSSWTLGTDGSSFRVAHVLAGIPDGAAAIYTSPNFATSYPSSLQTATNTTADFWVTNVANSGATVTKFENILLAWDLVRRG